MNSMMNEMSENRKGYHFEAPPQRSVDELVTELLNALPAEITEQQVQYLRQAIVLKQKLSSTEREDSGREALSEDISRWRKENEEAVDTILYKVLIGGFESTTHKTLPFDTEDNDVSALVTELAEKYI